MKHLVKVLAPAVLNIRNTSITEVFSIATDTLAAKIEGINKADIVVLTSSYDNQVPIGYALGTGVQIIILDTNNNAKEISELFKDVIVVKNKNELLDALVKESQIIHEYNKVV